MTISKAKNQKSRKSAYASGLDRKSKQPTGSEGKLALDLDVNKLSKKDCLSLTLFGLISYWPSIDPPMTSRENFLAGLSVMKFLKIYFSFPLKVTTRAAKISKFFIEFFFSNQFRIFEFCFFFSHVRFRTFVQHNFS